MAQITEEMIHCTYDVGKEINAKRLNLRDGSIEVSKHTGMRKSSAQFYISDLLAMLRGICYKRTINLYATEYYLKNIGIDFGRETQKQAARTVLEHVKYYSKMHGYLKSTENIAKKYI